MPEIFLRIELVTLPCPGLDIYNDSAVWLDVAYEGFIIGRMPPHSRAFVPLPKKYVAT